MSEQIAFLIAVLLAGLAAAGLTPDSAGRLRRLSSPTSPTSLLLGRFPRVAALTSPRPDAVSGRQRWIAGLAAGLVAAFAMRTAWSVEPVVSWIVGAVLAAVMIMTLGQLEAPAAKARRLQMITDLPHLLELLAAAIRAGLPLRAAVREVVAVADGPLADDLAGLQRGIDLGQDEAEAWRELRDHPALGRVSVDLARSVESGTTVARTLQRHAAIARRNRRGTLEARAKTVGVKTVPALMVCLVPSFLLISIVPSAVTAFRGVLF